VLSFLWIILMQYFAASMIWFTVISAVVSSSVFTAYIWYSWWSVKNGNQVNAYLADLFDTSKYNQDTLLVYGMIDK
jgi:hypothetical protein